ncbi:tyrosine-type recombinase/integrase [Mycobacterium sp.]|uniref:tyrosine-type recombinase/integrase n=1 Tax=Mycobacterium sp. TaxID=1785 RepID=UPI002D1364E2|nr:tyrosine-type recombinase/integrase [Mycobacterium sp.]HTY30632.1 tyrosine-type recombinase/integrase [Mycobacterium sp.]
MSSNAAQADSTPDTAYLRPVQDESAWLAWLRDHTDLNWRPGQWDPELWLFTCSPDDPTTLAASCAVANCPVVMVHGRLCQTCAKAFKQSGLHYDEFIKSYSRLTPRLRTVQRSNPARCTVEVNGRCCPSKGAIRKVCEYHYHQWNKRSRRGPTITLAEWMASGEATIPDEPLPDCIVPACLRESMTSATKVCRLHWSRYKRDRRLEPVDDWARQQLPHIGVHQFMLLNLPDRLRWEVLYALQQRSARGGRIDPENTKAVIRIMEVSPSLATMSKADVDRIAQRHNTTVGVHLHQFARALRNAHDTFLGRSAKDALVWDLDDVGFEPQPSGRRPRPRRRKCLDFGLITQPWLREVALAWSRQEPQSYLIVKTHRAAVVASQALEQRTDRGHDVTALGNRDVDAVAESIRFLTRVDNGEPCQTSFKRHIFAVFFDLITWGRRQGLLEGLPASFEPSRTRIHLPADPVVETSGKAIPETVQRQLDAQTDSVGRGFTHGRLTSEQTHQMFLTAYIVLRDTGRRTLEVASLPTDCLCRDATGPVLIYDNHKARRPGRRLPILESTAKAITDWREIRKTISTSSQQYLFPGSTISEKHLSSNGLSQAIRTWVRGLQSLDSGEIDSHGDPVPFDRSKIHPYAFRHSYAQRHADNGTPVDVLRQLMDHRSIQTTGGYYTITADRKRSAIETVGKFTIDKNGRAAVLTGSTAYQMRSVAVPFGNCIEPSNVKAGGNVNRPDAPMVVKLLVGYRGWWCFAW